MFTLAVFFNITLKMLVYIDKVLHTAKIIHNCNRIKYAYTKKTFELKTMIISNYSDNITNGFLYVYYMCVYKIYTIYIYKCFMCIL